jgi:hypothetical protein
MSNFKFLSIVLIAATTVVGPALARARPEASRHANTSVASVAGDAQGRGCMSAPRVGAFATQPWTNGNVPCEPGTGF